MDKFLAVFTVLLAIWLESCTGIRGKWLRRDLIETYISDSGDYKSYSQSQTFCIENNGSLVIADEHQIIEYIKSNVANGTGEPYAFFIGLKVVESAWTWINGKNLSAYSNTQIGKQAAVNKFCMRIGDNLKLEEGLPWNGELCQNSAGYICQRYISGKWRDWSQWSSCSSTCSKGIKSRTRQCEILHLKGNDLCQGQKTQKDSQECNSNLCKKFNGNQTACLDDGTVLPGCVILETMAVTTLTKPSRATTQMTSSFVGTNPPSTLDSESTTSSGNVTIPTASASTSGFFTSVIFYAIIGAASGCVLVAILVAAVRYRKTYILRVTDPKRKSVDVSNPKSNQQRMSTMEPMDVRLDAFADTLKIQDNYANISCNTVDEVDESRHSSVGSDSSGFKE